MTSIKDVAEYWNAEPCNTRRGKPFEVGSKEFYDNVEKVRYDLEPTIPMFADFKNWKGAKVLEVGCGLGTETTQFARAGADITAIDVSTESVNHTNNRLTLYGLKGQAIHMNAEDMQLKDDTFDLVYSWGVIHHSPNPQKVINEIRRVLKPSGMFKGMMYHRFSTMGIAVWIKDFLKYKQLVSLKTALDRSLESPGTKAYSIKELRGLFSVFHDVKFTMDYGAEYMVLHPRHLEFILKLYPKQLLSWVRIEAI